MDITALLRHARTAAGLSQEALAHRAGTSRTTLSAYEHGRKTPTADTLDRLLTAAGFALTATPRLTWTEHPVGRGRTGWVPSRLWHLPPAQALARIRLELHLDWSTPQRTLDLHDRRQRARAYEIVLREGTPDDLLRHVDGTLLADLWDDLVLPRPLRDAWQPVINAALHTPTRTDDTAVAS